MLKLNPHVEKFLAQSGLLNETINPESKQFQILRELDFLLAFYEEALKKDTPKTDESNNIKTIQNGITTIRIAQLDSTLEIFERQNEKFTNYKITYDMSNNSMRIIQKSKDKDIEEDDEISIVYEEEENGKTISYARLNGTISLNQAKTSNLNISKTFLRAPLNLTNDDTNQILTWSLAKGYALPTYGIQAGGDRPLMKDYVKHRGKVIEYLKNSKY